MDTTTAQDNGKIYEIGFHIAPIVGEEKIADEVSSIKGLLENQCKRHRRRLSKAKGSSLFSFQNDWRG
jgi:hypothetical protein